MLLVEIKMNLRAQYVIFMLVSSLLAGCSSLNTGGAPEPSFNLEADLHKLSGNLITAIDIGTYYKNANGLSPNETQKRTDRDKFITGRLALIDLQYLKFIRNQTSNKQYLDAGIDIANMSLNLTGALVGSASTKAILAATAAGLGGAKTTINKEFYYEKSIDALVATMNAKRQEVLLGILKGLNSTIAKYPFEQAITDLQQYYFAGTLLSALQVVNVQAGQSESKSAAKISEIRELTIPTSAQKKLATQITIALGTTTEAQAQAALTTLKVKVPTGINAKEYLSGMNDDAQQNQNAEIRTTKLTDILNAINNANTK